LHDGTGRYAHRRDAALISINIGHDLSLLRFERALEARLTAHTFTERLTQPAQPLRQIGQRAA
jgi:hypothetical protein